MIAWSQNTTHTPLPCTVQNAAGPLDLTGLANSAVVMKMRAATSGSTYATLAGAATITSAINGQFTYKFAAADVANVGNYKLVISITFAGNDPWNSFEQDFVITQSQ